MLYQIYKTAIFLESGFNSAKTESYTYNLEDTYEGKLYITGSDKIAVYDLDGLFLKDIKISGWFCYNHLSGFSNGFIYYWQYVPEGDDYFMRVKFDGSCQEHLLLDENGEFTMPDWWRQF